MIKNIKFEFDEKISPEPCREAAFTNNINMWLSEIEQEFNHSDAIAVMSINKQGESHLYFENITDEFNSRINEHLKKFQSDHR